MHPLQQTGPLPPGWGEATDPSDGARYFFNAATGEVAWDRPALTAPAGGFAATAALAPAPTAAANAWSVASDPLDGRIYYYNRSGETQWADEVDDVASLL